MQSTLGKIKKITDLRSVWAHEEYDFSQWLSEEENLALLSDAIGIDIVLEELESPVGGFSVDLYASEEGTGRKIIIENQLEDTNHDHLGKIITYASGKDASVVVWIVKRARDEHRQAIEWLNQHTDEQIGFFLVEIELWQIDDSAYAPMFKVVERPNDWAKEIKKVSATSNATQQARLEYWTAFNNYAFANKAFAKEFKQRKPSTDHWMSLSIGTSACGMSILRLQQQSQVGVELYINDDKELFRSLYERKAEIEADVGAELDWRELPEKKASLPEQHRPDECGICILYGCAGRRIRTRRAAGPTRIRKARQNHGCTHGGNPRYTGKGLLLLHGLNQTRPRHREAEPAAEGVFIVFWWYVVARFCAGLCTAFVRICSKKHHTSIKSASTRLLFL